MICVRYMCSILERILKYQDKLRACGNPQWVNCSCCCCIVAQSCLTLSNPMDCSPPGSSVHGDSPGKNTGVGCYALLQRIFPTQGSNPGFLHCRQILDWLSHQGNPKYSINIGLKFIWCLKRIWFPINKNYIQQGISQLLWTSWEITHNKIN